MKRLLCFILTLLLLIPSAMADEQTMTFRLESASGNVGDTVTVIGAAVNAPVCASFRVIMTYDDAVLKPESVKKLNCSGLFMSNVNFTYQGKPAINVLSADSNKSFEGDVQLFSITFTILAESPETNGSPINLVHQEFFDPSTPKPQAIQPTIETGCVYVGDDQPDDPTTGGNDDSSAEENTGSSAGDSSTDSSTEGNTGSSSGDNNSSAENNAGSSAGSNDDTSANGSADTPAGGTADTPVSGSTEGSTEDPTGTKTEETDKTPTGSWVVDTETEDIYHVDEEGNETVFVPEYTETPEPGKVTEVILKDKETGEEAGSIKVEGNEDGTFQVIEQDVPSLKNEEDSKTPTGSWIVDTETEDIYHVSEDGNVTVFEPEYTETPEPGKVTEVILKDKETGKEAGSLKVEGNEDGTFEVIEQDVPALRDPDNTDSDETKDPKEISIWIWVGIGGGVLLLAAGVALWYFLIFRKLK